MANESCFRTIGNPPLWSGQKDIIFCTLIDPCSRLDLPYFKGLVYITLNSLCCLEDVLIRSRQPATPRGYFHSYRSTLHYFSGTPKVGLESILRKLLASPKFA